MKYFLLTIGVWMISTIDANAQYEVSEEKKDQLKKETSRPTPKNSTPEVPFSDRLYFGGNLGLNFGTTTFINLSPMVGLKITEAFSVGVGITYMYFRTDYSNYGVYTQNVYGGRLFGRYNILEQAFLYAEYESLRSKWNPNKPDLFNIESTLIGVGYTQPLGESSSMFGMVLWNFTPSVYNPINPVIRFGFNIGI